MSQMYGNARTNFVPVIDIEGLKRSVEPFEIIIHHNAKDDTYCLVKPEYADYDFPDTIEDDDGNEISFTWTDNVMPFIKENTGLEVRTVAYDKRDLFGDTTIFIRHGDTVDAVGISLDNIYNMAKDKWGIAVKTIDS